jgi:hypothetical protein
MSDHNTTSETGESDGELRADGDAVKQEGLVPIDSKWFKMGFYLFLFGWLAYLLFETSSYSNRQDWLFPVIIGAPLVLLTLIKLLTIQYEGIVGRVLPDSATSGEDDMFEAVQEVGARNSKAEKEKYEIVMIGWVILLPFMMFFVGMGWTLIIYTFGFTWYFTRSVRTSALVTVVVIVFVWVLFIEILSLIVWDGALGLPAPLKTLANLRG